jgi:radical SAM protein with 4Fe4S-binding SPASM domain
MLANRKPKIDFDGLVRIPFPAEIAIETHSYCNFRCVVCPYVKMQRTKGKMAPELFRKIIDEVAQESPDTRLWLAIMGEPLMDKNLVSYLEYARERGARRIHLNTNGTFLEGRLAHDLLEAGCIESVYVAVDAQTAETYGKVRPGGDFPRVVGNIESFLELRSRKGLARPEIVVQLIVMDENAAEVEAFRDFWLERGAVAKIRLRQGWGRDISTPDLDKVTIDRFPCPWLIRTMNIHWTGHVTQCDCDYEENYSAGDINRQTIKEVWNGDLARRRDRHWSGDFNHPLCEKCLDWAAGRAEFFYLDRQAQEKAPRWSIGGKRAGA